MAFLIPDNLKSRSDVSAAIRRVASAFEVGLDDSAIVWYEPLYDPDGNKPHLVVLLPDRGIAVLEILDIKSGFLLGFLRGKVRFDRDGREVEADNPMVRAESLAETLRGRIQAEPRLKHMNLTVAAGAVLPSLAEEEAQKKGADRVLPLDLCLFKEQIDAAIRGTGEASLHRAFARIMGGAEMEGWSDEVEKVVRGIIQPEIVIDRVADVKSGLQLQIFRPPDGDDDVVRVMDRQQEAMAKSLGDGHRIIRGVAGSGKTLVLVYRARLLAQAFPQHTFLLTCYTKTLAAQLRELLKDCTNLTVVNLDSLMAEIIRAGRLKHPGYNDEGDGEAVAKVALQAIDLGKGPRFHGIFLDEAQDFGTVTLQLVTKLLRPERNDLVIVADAAQNIFRRKFSWKQAGIQAQGRTRILRVNYRNTREILEFASAFLLSGSVLQPDEVLDFDDENAVIPPESAARSGPPPVLRIVKDVAAEVEETVKQVIEWVREVRGVQQIAVLYTSSFDNGIDRASTLYERLRAIGIDVFWTHDRADPTAKARVATARQTVILTTIHSAKGLEFPHIALCGIWKEGQDTESNRKLAYVGMTRATKRLAVISREGHPLVEDLRKAAAAGAALQR
ncbi:MAG TPA: 3'-5' exonuclease [Candidatus Obscuribacterales bacterium]